MMWNVISQIVGTGFKVMKTRSETKQVKALAEQKHYERMLEGKIEYETAKQKGMDSEEAIEVGMKDKAKEFIDKGGEIYSS